MLAIVGLVSSISFILACGPGTGKLGSTATFEYEIYPPTIYTYSEEGNSYGQLSKDFAQKIATQDVRQAIQSVLQANSIPSNDATSQVTFEGYNIKLRGAEEACGPDAATKPEAKVAVYSGNYVVLYKCPATEGGQIDPRKFTVQVTAVQSIYQSQWDTLAQQVADFLENKRGTVFATADPIVTVQ